MLPALSRTLFGCSGKLVRAPLSPMRARALAGTQWQTGLREVEPPWGARASTAAHWQSGPCAVEPHGRPHICPLPRRRHTLSAFLCQLTLADCQLSRGPAPWKTKRVCQSSSHAVRSLLRSPLFTILGVQSRSIVHYSWSPSFACLRALVVGSSTATIIIWSVWPLGLNAPVHGGRGPPDHRAFL